jgi:hypothetical protein
MTLKVTNYEFKHPTTGESAHISHDVYGNGDEEYLSFVPGEKSIVHSSFEKARQRLSMHGYHNHETPVNEATANTMRAMFESIESGVDMDYKTAYYTKLVESGNYTPEDALLQQRRALFESAQGHKAVFPSVQFAVSFLDSNNAEKLSKLGGNLSETSAFFNIANEFKRTTLNESIDKIPFIVSETAAPGMEHWIIANKDRFIRKYGKKRGENILYATAWKIHDKKSLDEVFDRVNLEDTTDWVKTNVPDYIDALKSDGARQIKIKESRVPGTNDVFISFLKDGEWEIHHQNGTEESGKKLNNANPPMSMMTPVRNFIEAKVQSGHGVRIVSTKDHIASYKKMADSYASKTNKVVTDIEPHFDNLRNEHLFKFSIRPSSGKPTLTKMKGSPDNQNKITESVNIVNKVPYKGNPNTCLDETVMDALKHPKFGRVEWRNDGGAHMISSVNKETGSKNIHALGTHQEISKKWALIKDRLLKEDWYQDDGMALIEAEIAAIYGMSNTGE